MLRFAHIHRLCSESGLSLAGLDSFLEATLGAPLLGVYICQGSAQQRSVDLWYREGKTHSPCPSPAALRPGYGDYTRIQDFLVLETSLVEK